MIKQIKLKTEREIKKADGRRSIAVSDDKRGRYISDKMPSDNNYNDIALISTIRNAAVNQNYREKGPMAISVEKEDIREKKRVRKIGNTIIFVVDCSGSMGVSQRMKETKSAIFSLLIDAYQKRDKVALIVFKQKSAEMILPPTSSVELAKKKLEYIPTGGKSPLCHGLLTGYQCITSELKKHKECKPLLVVISDGRVNVGIDKNIKPVEEANRLAMQIRSSRIESLVIDTESGYIRLGKMKEIADTMGSRYLSIQDLRADKIIEAVR